jgi:predicted nucleic acid-binding protein
MNDKFFIDTNILVYSFDSNSPVKQQIAQEIIKKALVDHEGCISSQVIQEFLNVSSKKFNPVLSSEDCLKYLNTVLSPLCEIFTSIDLYRAAIEISERWKYAFYDSMIITAALQTNCGLLYSEDLQHNQKVQSLTIINPFIAA